MTHKQNHFVTCNMQQNAHSIHYIRHIFPIGEAGKSIMPGSNLGLLGHLHH